MSWTIRGSKPYVDLEDTDTAKKIRIQNDAGDTKVIDPSTGAEVTINGVTITSHASRHEAGGADEINLQGMKASGSPAEIGLEDTGTGGIDVKLRSSGGKAVIYDATNGVNLLIADQTTISDASGVSLASHASRHNRGGADAIDWSSISKWLNKSATGVAIGVAGSPASILRVDVEANYYNLLLKMIKLTPSGLATGESVTYHIIFYFSDGTNAEVVTKTGVTATITLTDADIDWSKIPDGVRVTAIEVTAESSATSTTATSDATIVALEF